MAEEKRDNLGLCNEAKIPFQDFVSVYCSRCFQPDCTRSLHGKSRFDHRIQNWEKTLFTEVSRLDPTDERFKEISAKRFLAVAPVQPNAPSAWLDPRDIESPKVISVPPPPVVVTPPPPSVLPPVKRPSFIPPAEPTPTPPPPAPKTEPAPPPAEPRSEPVIRNTAVKPRQMIGGAEQKPPSPVLDPWQPKQPLKPDDVLIQPGGRIKLT